MVGKGIRVPRPGDGRRLADVTPSGDLPFSAARSLRHHGTMTDRPRHDVTRRDAATARTVLVA